MKGVSAVQSVEPVNELAIVDTFTKLIFEEDDTFTADEVSIIQALRLADTTVVFDSYADMGMYLRALGVEEMIDLVSKVQRCLADVEQSPRQITSASSAAYRLS
ncbi:MAG: hypothetical protein AAGF57_11395 [Pseudomonadota bacterium]